MGTTRTAWHVLLASLLRERAPRGFEVRTEVPLSSEPLRADYLLLRTVAAATDPGRTLRKLWDLLPRDTILELKSIGRPYRSRNLDRLWAYLHLYYADQPARLEQRSDLCGVLLVPARTPSLDADVQTLGLAWRALGGGYWSLAGGPFALHVAEVDVVAETEQDEQLRFFGHDGLPHTVEGRRWLSEQLGAKEVGMAMHELEGYDEVIAKLLATLPPEERVAGLSPKERIAGLPPEERVAGLSPEERVAGLSPDQRVPILPDDLLRGLSAESLATLSEATRAAIRARIGR